MFPLNYIVPNHYYEVVQDTPFILTPTTTPTALLPAYPYKWVFSYMIRVRSMGTATYIGIGNETAQLWRLTAVGQIFGFNGNPKEVIDLTKVWYVSDTSDAVIEVVALYMPLPLQGDVVLAKTRGLP